MGKKIKRIINRRTVLTFLIALAICTSIPALKIYFTKVDAAAKEIQNATDLAYETKNDETNNRGFYVANFKAELEEFMADRNASTLTYEFAGESFFLEVFIQKNEEGEYSFEIEKISNPEFDINARMNMKDVESIEYRTGNPSKASVLKINQKYNSDYFAMTDGTYYFLGDDIESISYKNNHFYYMTYNPDYKSLEEATVCSPEITSKIEGFKMSDYYYNYGKINFLSDYYQKLSSKKFTVQEKCDELAEKAKNQTDDRAEDHPEE